MSLFTNYLKVKDPQLLDEQFNVYDFMEYACSTSEGACPFHKIKLSSERGKKFIEYSENQYNNCIRNLKENKKIPSVYNLFEPYEKFSGLIKYYFGFYKCRFNDKNFSVAKFYELAEEISEGAAAFLEFKNDSQME